VCAIKRELRYAASVPKHERKKEEEEKEENEKNSIMYASIRLYELIFKRIPDDLLYMEDMHKYKIMVLLAMNAHKHKHHSQGRVLSNRGYKYKHIITAVGDHTKETEEIWKRITSRNDSAINYMH